MCPTCPFISFLVASSMLYLVGLGLCDAKDITIKGLEIVKKCDRVYLESYTSILGVNKEELEAFYGREVIAADRDMVEQQADELLDNASGKDVALLVIGDPFGATTHTDIILRAIEKGIKYEVVHNASIMNAVGCCGLQLYSFGETVSIVFWTDTWKPESFYDKIVANKQRGLHTLCLLDIKVKEQSLENLMRGKKIYEPPRFMSVAQAANQLLEVITRRRHESDGDIPAVCESTPCIGLARVGSSQQRIVAASLEQMATVDLGPPLHSLVVAGTMHPLEASYVAQFALQPDAWQTLVNQQAA